MRARDVSKTKKHRGYIITCGHCGWCGDRPDPGMQFCSDDCAEKHKASRSGGDPVGQAVAAYSGRRCEYTFTVHGALSGETIERCALLKGHGGKHATATAGGFLVEVPNGR